MATCQLSKIAIYQHFLHELQTETIQELPLVHVRAYHYDHTIVFLKHVLHTFIVTACMHYKEMIFAIDHNLCWLQSYRALFSCRHDLHTAQWKKTLYQKIEATEIKLRKICIHFWWSTTWNLLSCYFYDPWFYILVLMKRKIKYNSCCEILSSYYAQGCLVMSLYT